MIFDKKSKMSEEYRERSFYKLAFYKLINNLGHNKRVDLILFRSENHRPLHEDQTNSD